MPCRCSAGHLFFQFQIFRNSDNWRPICQDGTWIGFTGISAGMVGYFNRSSCPAGWAAANGSGGTPDLRRRFVRGVGGNSGALGAVQEDAIRNITGTFSTVIQGNPTSGAFYQSGAGTRTKQYTDWDGQILSFDASRVVPTANENRPVNVALLACIKS